VSAALKGKRVILTRAVEQSEEWIRALESRGAEVLMLPAIRITQPETWSLLDRELLRLHEFDWVLFTSRNAVRFIAERLAELDCALCCSGQSSPRVAAVGESTAEAARQKGWRVDCVPQKQDGESLARELHESLAGRRVLLPRSDRADDRLAISLEKSGANVREVVAYLTLAPESFDGAIAERLLQGNVDWVVFASPSAFHNLSHGLGDKEVVALSSRVHFLAIGPTTAKAMRAAGAQVELEASAPDAEGVSKALCEYYEPPAATARSASTTGRPS
jgi:uroporphyrinogen III methyltransferase / synthase